GYLCAVGQVFKTVMFEGKDTGRRVVNRKGWGNIGVVIGVELTQIGGVLEVVGVVFTFRDHIIGLNNIGDVGGIQCPAILGQYIFYDFSRFLIWRGFGDDDADGFILVIGTGQTAAGHNKANAS